MLLDTLAAVFASNGSASETAQKLYRHTNTVWHRLRRIETQTGDRSMTPAVADLRIALETIRWLPLAEG